LPGRRGGEGCRQSLRGGKTFRPVDEVKELQFAARVRAGFIPATRREIFSQIKHLKSAHCPFANLPDRSPGRFGQGLTAEKMRECVWLKPDAS
jgi:bifunctional non-homologous end joining protein LigD